MFKLRSVKIEDLDHLFRLSQHYQFISLPSDLDMIEKKILNSQESFSNPQKELWKNNFIFVIEDLSSNAVIGCSMIHAQHGTEKEPHFYLTVSQENKFCKTLNTGFIHGTLKLGLDTNGPTEIGGLILDSNFRGHPHKLGKQLSFVRFLFMALHREYFKEEVHSELMPPFDKDGRSPLWEAIGRRFLNMEYIDADVLSRSNKEFILDLYPSQLIYETLLPIEARHAIGKVGKDTWPVQKMLTNVGFTYHHEVDPFDGGPHYRAKLADIVPVKRLFNAQIVKQKGHEKAGPFSPYLLNIEDSGYDFSAFFLEAVRDGNDLYPREDFFNAGIIEAGNSYSAIPL